MIQALIAAHAQASLAAIESARLEYEAARDTALGRAPRPRRRVDRYPLRERPAPTWWDAYKPLFAPLAFALLAASPLIALALLT